MKHHHHHQQQQQQFLWRPFFTFFHYNSGAASRGCNQSWVWCSYQPTNQPSSPHSWSSCCYSCWQQARTTSSQPPSI
jgi:hypothetical protein